MQVVKRDGAIVGFDRSKIAIAIQKANNSVDEADRVSDEQIEQIIQFIESRHKERLLVEDIQTWSSASSWSWANIRWPRAM